MRVYIVLITYMTVGRASFKCKTKDEATVKNRQRTARVFKANPNIDSI